MDDRDKWQKRIREIHASDDDDKDAADDDFICLVFIYNSTMSY